MPAPKPKRGRPPHAITASTHYTVNVTPEDRALIDQAAALEHERFPSRWVRKVALDAAIKAIGERAAKPERKGR